VSALIITGSMFLIAGMTASAIDASAAFVERLADQTAADIGAVAGGLETLIGVSAGGVSDTLTVAASLDYVRQNLPTTYTDPEWQALWEGCVDPAAERNEGGTYNFVALAPPPGWNVVDPANWCISRDAAASLYRVRTPDQVVETTFARIIGFNSLQTHAAAVVNIIPAGSILPFGFPSGTADGGQHCLSAGPTGLSEDPCSGPLAGNFGTLKIKRFTPSPYLGCLAAPTNSVLALNIAAGIDHIVVPLEGHNVANEVRDECYNPNVNTLQTDVGFPTGTEAGLATGAGLPAGETALLQQGPQPKQNVVGYQLDDAPLWNWLVDQYLVDSGPPPLFAPIDFGGRDTPADPTDDAPLFCDPAGFDNSGYDFDGDGTPEIQYDFDGDGTDDDLESWQHMQRCLLDYAAGELDPFAGTTASSFLVIFSSSLGDRDSGNSSARFAYVPQFWDNSLGAGISEWLHIWRYRAIFIQGTWWQRGTSWIVHHPGEACTPCTGGGLWSLWQVSAFIIPDGALPSSLRGDPPGVGTGFINPYIVRIYR
jgi:hypothetical protein